MLVCHSKTAQSMGIPAENMLIIDNGDVVELTADSIAKGEPVKAGIELLDASRNGIVDARVLKERQQLADDGVITMLAVISTDGVMAAPPRVNLRGVVTAADARKLSLWAEREITWVLENRWQQLSRFPKPTIAMVNGVAAGAGLSIAGSTLTAQLVGARNPARVGHVAGQTFLMVILSAIVLGIAGWRAWRRGTASLRAIGSRWRAGSS